MDRYNYSSSSDPDSDHDSASAVSSEADAEEDVMPTDAMPRAMKRRKLFRQNIGISEQGIHTLYF